MSPKNLVTVDLHCSWCGDRAEGSMDPTTAERFIKFWKGEHEHDRGVDADAAKDSGGTK